MKIAEMCGTLVDSGTADWLGFSRLAGLTGVVGRFRINRVNGRVTALFASCPTRSQQLPCSLPETD